MNEQQSMPPYIPVPSVQPSSASSAADAEFNKWLEDMSEELTRLYHDLRNEKLEQVVVGKLPDGSPLAQWQWLKTPETEPMLNEKGINFILNNLRPLLSKNTYVSNLSQDEISRIGEINSRNLWRSLFFNWESWAVNPNYAHSVVNMHDNVVQMGLYRAMNEGERRFLRQTISTHNVVTGTSNPQQQRGAFGGFLDIFRHKG